MSCLMDQLSYHLMSYCSLLPLCTMTFWNDMIFSLLCINSQPISHVINVYYETQMMILNVNCIYHKGYQLLFLYSFLLSTESWREMKRVLCYNALWWSPCDCVLWYVNECCLKLSISGSSLFLFIKPPWHFWCAFLQPMLAWPSEVAGIIPSVPGAITD